MRRLLAVGLIFLLAGTLLGYSASWIAPVFAQDEQPPEQPLTRKVTLTIDYTAFDWWLLKWSDNSIVCNFAIDHEGLPTQDDVRSFCGSSLGNQWAATKGCSLQADQTTNDCKGLYVVNTGFHPASREVEVELPLPSVYLSLEGCVPQAPGNTCSSLPTLRLTGEEPLPNEEVINIVGTIGGEPFSCLGAECTLPVKPTGRQGVSMEFWAQSSYGDESEHYTAMVRVLPWGNFMDPDVPSGEPQTWYTDVISSQWRGPAAASCADTWQVFPEIGGPEPWLRTPEDSAELFSDFSLYYLAGALLSNGQIEAPDCPNGGLSFDEDMVANECGVNAAYDQVVEWQNLFDAEIWQTAVDTGVPAQLIKNVFNRESQFWPGIYRTYKEAGLGQLTELGADTMLLWNPSFYDQFCPLVLHQETCDLGWGNLDAPEQNMLRGALVAKVNAACPDCPAGIDISQAQFSVRVFAEGLLANCEQVGRIIHAVTDETPGAISSYEDLWRMTLANYNAGPGCLTSAVEDVAAAGEAMTWENVASKLEEGCWGAIGYVDDITTNMSGVTPTPTSWVYPGDYTPLAPELTPQPTVQGTPEPGVTTTPSPPPEPGYNPPDPEPDETEPPGYNPPDPDATFDPGY